MGVALCQQFRRQFPFETWALLEDFSDLDLVVGNRYLPSPLIPLKRLPRRESQFHQMLRIGFGEAMFAD